jgi:hypothetical protein
MLHVSFSHMCMARQDVILVSDQVFYGVIKEKYRHEFIVNMLQIIVITMLLKLTIPS